MAKQIGPVTVRGKVGGHVFTDGKYGKQVRAKTELTAAQKKAKADLPQNRRTAKLNALASSLRHGVDHYAGALKPGKFYSNVHSLFREQKINDHRAVLLQKLENLEVHEKYQFQKICPLPEFAIQITKTHFVVNIDINYPAKKDGFNCYYLQFILFVWNDEDSNSRNMDFETPWIAMADSEEKFTTAKFKRTAKDTEYVLACRCVLGRNEQEDSWTDTGMRFLRSGTLTETGRRALEENAAAAAAAQKAKAEKKVVVKKSTLVLRNRKDKDR